MNRITSFCVDHRKLEEGIYISRIDGDCITYDIRTCKPNSGIVMDNSTIHTTEHIIATFLRNSEISDEVIYFGPMGCQTGFYLIVRDSVSGERVIEILKESLEKTLKYEGEVFGASEVECGNYKNLDLANAKKLCGAYLAVLKDIIRPLSYDCIN